MSEHEVDLVLRWKDGDAKARPVGDHVDVGEEAVQEAAQVVHAERPVAAATADERFQWTKDRDDAIDAALGAMSGLPLARVHQQLEKLWTAIERDALPPEQIAQLLDEVDRWLAREVGRRTARPPLRHDGAMGARALVLDALNMYLEISRLLRDALTGDAAVLSQTVLARRLADQAASFVHAARHALLDAAPPVPGG